MGFGTSPPEPASDGSLLELLARFGSPVGESMTVGGESFPVSAAPASPVAGIGAGGSLAGGRGLQIADALRKARTAETLGRNTSGFFQMLVMGHQAANPFFRQQVVDAFSPLVETDRDMIRKLFGDEVSPSLAPGEAKEVVGAGFSGGEKSTLRKRPK